MSASTAQANPGDMGLSPGQKGLIGFFAAVGLALAGWIAYRQWQPRPVPPPAGTRPNVAEAAQAYLRKEKATALSGPLADLLKPPPEGFVPSKPGYPLLGQPAPDFTLVEALGQKVSLKDLLAKGPVVLVFYYGYHCDHCVSQLFDLNEDLKYFQELGASVVAISADSPDTTLEKYAKFGRFHFPVLSDPGNKVAQLYGTYLPPDKGAGAFLWHGTFVISPEGKITWANWGDEPFTGNRTLLHEVAKLRKGTTGS